jgi:hypothetical protein
MKKLITNLVLLLAIVSIASAASVSTNSANYDVGDTIEITVSDCSAGSAATLNIQGFWADQGTSDSSNEYTSSYTIPAGFNSGTYTLNANCAGTAINTNFCVNPGCSTDSGSSESDSGSGGSSGSSSGAGITTVEEVVVPEPKVEEEPEEEPEELPTYFIDEEIPEEGNSALMYSMIAVIVLILLVGGLLLWRKSKKPQEYVQMPQTQ